MPTRMSVLRETALAISVILAASSSEAVAQAPSFTAEQATRVKAIYDEQCAVCHGTELDNGVSSSLAGEAFEKWRACSKWGRTRTLSRRRPSYTTA